MDSIFWNKRYEAGEYAYGKAPNDYLKEVAFRIPANSKVLCLAEGEGRNAVYLATLGHAVTAIDYSEEGIRKTLALAKEHHVEVTGVCADLNEYEIELDKWDAIVAIFAHFPPAVRDHVWTKAANALKKGGVIIAEVYHTDQVEQKTGGPQVKEMLYTTDLLHQFLNQFSSCSIKRVERHIEEGKFHLGHSVTLQVFAAK